MRNPVQQFKINIVLVSLALAGLIGLQAVLIHNAYQSERASFQQTVQRSLQRVVDKMETLEAVDHIMAVGVTDSLRTRSGMVAADRIAIHAGDQELADSLHARRLSTGDARMIWRSTPQTRTIEQDVTISVTADDSMRVKKIIRQYPADSAFGYSYTVKSGVEDTLDQDNRNRLLVTRLVGQLGLREPKPLSERIRPALLDSLVAATLAEAGLQQTAYWGIVDTRYDSVIVHSNAAIPARLLSSGFSAPAFPFDFMQHHFQLVLDLPEATRYALGRIWLMMAASLIFMALVIGGYVQTVQTVFKQRKLASAMTDFVNNMTHEFRTPISTITLAAESLLQKDKKQSDPAKQQRYSKIIRDEAQRMREQTEKILQMAVLERGEDRLNLEATDVHMLLSSVIDSFSLQVERAGGKLESTMHANAHIVIADQLHFTNILHNLIDNALKYGGSPPHIRIHTQAQNSELKVKISDNGKGMVAAERKQIFTKYYRIPTGNVHDVKGFGLGLSYVKLLTEAHGGSIKAKAAANGGTTFVLTLPLQSEHPDGQ